jgi:hypothetical protein
MVVMMHINEQTSNKLTLRHSQLSFRRLFIETLLTGIGIGLLLWSGPTKLNCQRVEPKQIVCQLSTPGWLGLGIWWDKSIRNLQDVRLTRDVDDGVYFQVILQTSDGEVPLRQYKTSGWDNTEETVDRIKTFLKDPAINSLSVLQVDWLQWFGLVPGVFFSLIGLRLLYISLFSIQSKAIESYCFDQTQNSLIYQYGSLLRQKQERYAFSDIHRIILDLDLSAKARLFLTVRSGEMICLSGEMHPSVKNMLQGSEIQQLQPIANEVSRRVRCPYQLSLGLGQSWMQNQLAQNNQARAVMKFLKVGLETPDVWIFDHSAGSVTSEDRTRSENLKDIVDVQVTSMGEPTAKSDSDGDTFYTFNYQLGLMLTSGKRIAIQQFSYTDYNWKSTQGKPTAQKNAEAIAELIQQYIHKD